MPDSGTVHVVVVAAVIDPHRGLLLVRKRDDGAWGCPQGWLRPGETPRETAKRKVSEETGVLVSVDNILSIRTSLVSEAPPVGNVHLLVHCHPLAGTPRPGVCELEASYVSFESLPEMRDGLRDWIVEGLAGEGKLLE